MKLLPWISSTSCMQSTLPLPPHLFRWRKVSVGPMAHLTGDDPWDSWQTTTISLTSSILDAKSSPRNNSPLEVTKETTSCACGHLLYECDRRGFPSKTIKTRPEPGCGNCTKCCVYQVPSTSTRYSVPAAPGCGATPTSVCSGRLHVSLQCRLLRLISPVHNYSANIYRWSERLSIKYLY